MGSATRLATSRGFQVSPGAFGDLPRVGDYRFLLNLLESFKHQDSTFKASITSGPSSICLNLTLEYISDKFLRAVILKTPSGPVTVYESKFTSWGRPFSHRG